MSGTDESGGDESPQDELDRLRAEVASLKANAKKDIRLKVSAKGGTERAIQRILWLPI